MYIFAKLGSFFIEEENTNDMHHGQMFWSWLMNQKRGSYYIGSIILIKGSRLIFIEGKDMQESYYM